MSAKCSLYVSEFPDAPRDEYGKLVRVSSHEGKPLGYAPATAWIRVYEKPGYLVAEYLCFSAFCDDDDTPHQSAIDAVREAVAADPRRDRLVVSFIGVRAEGSSDARSA